MVNYSATASSNIHRCKQPFRCARCDFLYRLLVAAAIVSDIELLMKLRGKEVDSTALLQAGQAGKLRRSTIVQYAIDLLQLLQRMLYGVAYVFCCELRCCQILLNNCYVIVFFVIKATQALLIVVIISGLHWCL